MQCCRDGDQVFVKRSSMYRYMRCYTVRTQTQLEMLLYQGSKLIVGSQFYLFCINEVTCLYLTTGQPTLHNDFLNIVTVTLSHLTLGTFRAN